MSTVKYLHKVLNESVKDGKKTTYEESIIDGTKGLTLRFFKKSEKGVEKINIVEKNKKFFVKKIKGDKKEEHEFNREKVLEFIKKEENLAFAKEFLKTQTGGALLKRLKSGSKKGSKAGSKKGSKKGSKRNSRKAGSKRK